MNDQGIIVLGVVAGVLVLLARIYQAPQPKKETKKEEKEHHHKKQNSNPVVTLLLLGIIAYLLASRYGIIP